MPRARSKRVPPTALQLLKERFRKLMAAKRKKKRKGC